MVLFSGPSLVGAYVLVGGASDPGVRFVDTTSRATPSDFTGSLSYEIDIVVPPGRNGLQPDIKVVYDSNENEVANIFGKSWGVNIPYIQRINRYGTDRLYGTTTPSYFYSSVSGELATTSTDTYSAKIDDGSFITYTFENDTWTAVDKLGTQYVYGSSTSSRLDNPNDSSQIFRWMLHEVRDTNDNYITYEYDKDGGQIYPSRIVYTGHGGAEGPFDVEFERESRNDVATSSVYGFEVVTRDRISEIRTEFNDTWVRKYEIGYTTASTKRSLLETVTESGRDESGNTVALPANTFSYATAAPGWTYDAGWGLPGVDIVNAGTYIIDVNGDELTDVVQSNASTNIVFLNDGDGSWTEASYDAPTDLDYDNTKGAGMADLNGDGLIDVYHRWNGTSDNDVWLNTGEGWSLDANWSMPDVNYQEEGTYLLDLNGDGLADVLESRSFTSTNNAYINDGDGTWTADSDWHSPIYLDFDQQKGAGIADINGDGLPDVYRAFDGSPFVNAVYLNDGHGWSFTPDLGMPNVHYPYGNAGYQYTDVNGDGFSDFVGARQISSARITFINNGDGSWTEIEDWDYTGWLTDNGSGIGDLNGDGIADTFTKYSVNNVYLSSTQKIDLLAHVTTSDGAEYSYVYTPTPQYVDGGVLENPDLPFILHTISEIGEDDGFGNIATTTFNYGGGEYFYNGPFDKRLAGFATTTEVDAEGNILKKYFHQGNGTIASLGEYSDDESKIGREYRREYQSSTSTVYRTQVRKWENTDIGNDRDFVVMTRETTIDYDGDAPHKDTSDTYSYSTTTGNLIQQVMWGEVTASDDGSFSDTGTDKFTMDISYASSSNVSALRSIETLKDQSSSMVSEVKRYYDDLSLGNVDEGNETKTENWISGSTYASSTRSYNSYGLVTQVTDPRSKTTSYVIDPFSLYVATTTNPLSQTTEYTYFYGIGEAKQTTDSNGNVFQTIYDGLGRVIEEKQPDLTTPSTLVTKATYSYTDNTLPTVVHMTDYLSSATSTDVYTYFDGLRREVQKRTEAEASFVVADTVYNSRGLTASETMPYFSSGSSYTSATTTPALYTNYTYDPLGRILTSANAVGTTSTSYNDWKITVTDATGGVKDQFKDAYENLVRVDEHDDGNTYSTYYEYDGLKNLTKFTDALTNIRNFTYDGLGRRLTAQDLHDSADGTYGTWTYTYDSAGNITQSLDPKSQAVNYTYDDINRILTEDYTGIGGTEISYGYDLCDEGVGRLCVATTTDVVSTYAYNSLGLVASETKNIDAVDYLTAYSYDRLGNLADITYPNSSIVAYGYDDAGLLETVARKPNGSSTYLTAISELDYAPTGAISYKAFGNGVSSTYTYDANHLYRLTNILTIASSTEVNESGGVLGMLEWPSYALAPLKEVLAKATPQWIIQEVLDENGPQPAEGSETTKEPLITPEEEVLITETKPDEEVATTTPQSVEGSEESVATTSAQMTTPDESGDVPAVQEVSVAVEPVVAKEFTGGPYADKGDHYELFITQQQRNAGSAKVEIMKDKPQVRLKKWNEEVNLGVSYNKVQAGVSRTHSAEQVEWKGEGEEVHAYPLPVADGMEDGGFEIEVYLKEKPNTKEFSFVLDGTENLDFFYQPPLTEERSRHEDTCTETQCVDVQGRVTAVRPENVIGSYAVYHKSKSDYVVGHTNYATGKAFHVYRPKAIDANGNETWGTLNFANNTLSVVVPEEFLEKATYPVRVDPTFGYTSIGGSQDYLEPDWVDGARYTTPSDIDTIESLTWYNQRFFSSDHFKAVVYDSSGNLVTNGVGDETNSPASFAWTTSSFSTAPSVSGSTNYAITIVTDGEPDFKYDSVGGTYEIFDDANDYDSPTSVPSSDAGNWRHSLYATYTTTGGGNNAPSAPTSLETEGMTNPTDITDPTPELSAVYNDPDSGDIADYYQIQVATSSSFTSPYWDSTKTSLASSTPEGTRIADISYGGSALASSTIYYWRIKFWDDSDEEGAWSTATSTFSLAAAGNSAPTAPTSLETEGMTNPTNLSDPTPEFTAVYNDPDGSDQAVFYQLQVATTSSFGSAYWDSGKTAMATTTQGNESPEISYAGSALASSTTYYWRIKFWDDDDAEGVWSTATSTFSLAEAGGGGGGLGVVLQNIFYTYDNVGNIVNISDYSDTGAGKIANFGYDDLYRLTSAETVSASSTSFSNTYTYDAIGNITNKSDQGAYEYAETGYANPQAVTSIGNGVATTTYAYDNNGNLISTDSWAYTWDYRNRLTQSSDGSATTYGYDHDNQRVKKTVSGTTTVYPNKYFNVVGATTTFHIMLPDGSLVATVEQVAGEEGGGSATSTGFRSPSSTGTTWDEWTSPSNAYSSNDSRATTFGLTSTNEQDYSDFSFSVPSGATIDGIEIEVEAQRLQTDQDLDVQLSWDGGSSFTSAKTNTINTSSDSVYTYGSSVDTWGRTWSDTDFSDANFLLYAKDTTSTNRTISTDHIRVKIHYTPSGGGGGGSIATTTSYIHGDHLGSTNVVTDENGLVDEVVDYYPYGEQRISETFNATPEQRKFTGFEYDEQSDLHYAGARYYDQDIGKFISQDPVFQNMGVDHRTEFVLRDPQLANSYSYARNNPLILTDSNGEFIDVVADVGFTLFSAYKLGEAIFTGGDVKGEAVNFALDAGGLFIPGAAGLGTIKRAANAVDNATDAVGGTYKLLDRQGNVIRTGRTNNLDRRELEHARGSDTRGLDFEVDKRTDSYSQQRGREQIIHDQHPEARIENGGLNKQNPISNTNPKRQDYLDSASDL